MSTKLTALINDLRTRSAGMDSNIDTHFVSDHIRSTDSAFRAVVFSQFTSFLDLIETALDREKFDHYRYDGTLDVKVILARTQEQWAG